MKFIITIFLSILSLQSTASAFGEKEHSTAEAKKTALFQSLDATRFPWTIRVATSELQEAPTSAPLHIVMNGSAISVGPCISVDQFGVQLDPQECINLLGTEAEKRLEKIRIDDGKVYFRSALDHAEILLGTFSLEDPKKVVAEENPNIRTLPLALSPELKVQIDIPATVGCSAMPPSHYASRVLNYGMSLGEGQSKEEIKVSRMIIFRDYNLCDIWLHTWPPLNY